MQEQQQQIDKSYLSYYCEDNHSNSNGSSNGNSRDDSIMNNEDTEDVDHDAV